LAQAPSEYYCLPPSPLLFKIPNMAPVEQTFLPIAELSSYIRNWTIKARITNKAPLRTFKKGAGEGKVFSVDMLDVMGGEIRATFFNQAAEKYFDVLEKGKCFTLTKGTIKVANKQYNNCNHRYELTFDKEAVVEPAAEDAEIKTVQFNFVTLKALGARTLPTTVDICGVITSFLPTQTVNTKEGVALTKREITVVDDTATSVSVTLWGDRANRPESDFQGNPTVVMKGVNVKEFRESRSGSMSQNGEFQLNSKTPEAVKAMEWFSAGGSSQKFVSISEGAAAGTGQGRNATATTLAGLRLASERLSSQPEIFSIVARLAGVQTRKQGEAQPLYYMACMEKNMSSGYSCNKRVDERGFCATCDRTGKSEPRVTMRCSFVDFGAAAWLTSFHEASTKIVGMDGNEVKTMEAAATDKGEAGREELETALRKKYFGAPMQLTVRAKMDSYNGESRTNCTVIDARPVSRADHGRMMLKEINELMSQQTLASVGA